MGVDEARVRVEFKFAPFESISRDSATSATEGISQTCLPSLEKGNC